MSTLKLRLAPLILSVCQMACPLEDPCDPGQFFDEATFTCGEPLVDAAVISDAGQAAAPDAASGATPSDGGESGAEDAGAGDAQTDAGDVGATDAGACPSEFGKACAVSSECGCDTSYCAVNPRQAGFCTITRCLSAPELCPAGFRCVDISTLAPELESLCGPN
ncbi:MAG: hypothetical protein AAFU79_01400 [Myxococcota bacterium]